MNFCFHFLQVFTGIFFAEVVVKVAAFGVKVFFRNAWCVFDFLVVVISLVDIGLELTRTTGLGLRVLRTFRLVSIYHVLSSSVVSSSILFRSILFFPVSPQRKSVATIDYDLSSIIKFV